MLCTSKIELRFSAIVAVICAAPGFGSRGGKAVMYPEKEFDPAMTNWSVPNHYCKFSIQKCTGIFTHARKEGFLLCKGKTFCC